jgi:ubiquinol-cytochrome c reductase cytochrome b subunit
MRLPHGEYIEKHAPISQGEAWVLTAHERRELLPEPATEDVNGVVNPGTRKQRLRVKLQRFWYADDVPKPTRAELEEAHAHAHGDGHAEHGHEIESGADGGADRETGQHELEQRH